MASILLPVPQILQNPELPNGCEITSCCEVLHYLGFAPDNQKSSSKSLAIF